MISSYFLAGPDNCKCVPYLQIFTQRFKEMNPELYAKYLLSFVAFCDLYLAFIV